MPQKQLEAASGVIGDELTRLAGFYSTRLEQVMEPASQLQSAVQTLDYDGVVDVTLSSGTFSASAIPGTVIRLLSGPLAGAEATIDAGGAGGNTATLAAAFEGAAGALTDLSWEVIQPADTSAVVESTFQMDPSGEVRIDGVRYRYASLTTTTLDGLEHFDVDQWRSGAQQRHEPLAEVLDWSRTRSELEKTRRAMFVAYATGEDLSVVGRNEGVDRPPELADDEAFRAFIQAVAYGRKGTLYVVEQVLDAILGPGAWEHFEDFTKGEDGDEPGNHNLIFLRRTNDLGTDPLGRTYLDDQEVVDLDSDIELTLPRVPTAAGGVLLYPEGESHVVAFGEGAFSSDGGASALLRAPGVFPVARIFPGDTFELTSGYLKGKRATVSDTRPVSGPEPSGAVEFGFADGAASQTDEMDGSFGTDFTDVAWRIVRDKTNCRFYRPTSEVLEEYPGGPFEQVWEFVGQDENTQTALGLDGVYGNRLRIVDTAALDYAAYRKILRVEPEGDAEVEIFWDPAILELTDPMQVVLLLSDGERVIGIGTQLDGAGHPEVGFIDAATGAFIGAPIIGSGESGQQYSPGMQLWRLRKRGRGAVEFWHQAWQGAADTTGLRLEQRAAYTDFPTVAAWAAAAPYVPYERELLFGCLSQVATASAVEVKWISWHTGPMRRDYWNARIDAAQTTAPDLLDDVGATGIIEVGDVGKTVYIPEVTALNAEGGNARGEWEVLDVPGADQMQLIGRTEPGAGIMIGHTALVEVHEHPGAFRYPDVLGHELELLDGPNAGRYPIVAVVDPETQDDVTEARRASHGAAVAFTSPEPGFLEGDLVDVGFGPQPIGRVIQIRLWGLVGGVLTSEDIYSAGTRVFPESSMDPGAWAAMSVRQKSAVVSTEVWDDDSLVAAEVILGNEFFSADTLEIVRADDMVPIFRWDWRTRGSVGRPGWRTFTTITGLPWLPEIRTNLVRVDPAAGTPAKPNGFTPAIAESRWRLRPLFPTEASPHPTDIVDAGTRVGAVMTMRQALPAPYGAGTPVVVRRAEVRSAHLTREAEINVEDSNGNRTLWPFYVYDAWGFLRRVLDVVMAAGYFIDFDRFTRDAETGPHILEE